LAKDPIAQEANIPAVLLNINVDKSKGFRRAPGSRLDVN